MRPQTETQATDRETQKHGPSEPRLRATTTSGPRWKFRSMLPFSSVPKIPKSRERREVNGGHDTGRGIPGLNRESYAGADWANPKMA